MTQNQVIRQINSLYLSHLKISKFIETALPSKEKKSRIVNHFSKIEREFENFKNLYTWYSGNIISKQFEDVVVGDFDTVKTHELICSEIKKFQYLGKTIYSNIHCSKEFKNCLFKLIDYYTKLGRYIIYRNINNDLSLTDEHSNQFSTNNMLRAN